MDGFADDALANALLLCEYRGWVHVYVPHSAGSNFKDGHYIVFYRDTFGKERSAMVRKLDEVLCILSPPEMFKIKTNGRYSLGTS